MRISFFKKIKYIYRGDSVARILMHEKCTDVSVDGLSILDVGSGAKLPNYYSFFNGKPRAVTTTDMKSGAKEHVQLNFEKDHLPFNTSSFDCVCAFNILEHIFNFNFLLSEMYRVLKPGGFLVGFVPFLVNYHPDPHDYFRYTEEALQIIFEKNNFNKIEIVPIGGSAFMANFNTIMLSFPKIMRVFLFPCYASLNFIFMKFRPNIGRRYPLGYFFVAHK